MKYEDYKPHDEADRFAQMTKFLSTATTIGQLDARMMLYLMDPSYHREDILVARERVAETIGP